MRLTQKGERYVLTEECDVAFEELKHRLIKTPMLVVPDDSGGTVILSDASGKGLECVLIQHG